jgi:hypothetical protein
MGEQLQSAILFRGVALALLTPPIVALGYLCFRDPEKLEFYTGSGFWFRVAICCVVYVGLWAAVGALQENLEFPREVWQWFVVAPPMVVLGSLAALGCFDFEFGNAFLHYAFYVFIILALRMVAGMPHLWELGL